MKQQLLDLADQVRRIEALATNPHWTADRRWRIAEIASKVVGALDTLANADPRSEQDANVASLQKNFPALAQRAEK